MKRLSQFVSVSAVAAALLLSAAALTAQNNNPPPGDDRGGRGRGGFDPEQMRQRMMERVKEQLEVTADDEWKALEPLINKVFEARRDAMASSIRGFFGRGPGGDRGGDRGRGGFGESSAEAKALDKAIESKASKDELKNAMAKFRAAKKDKENKVKEAQEKLREVLSLRQEAIAVANGWLD